MWPVSAPGPDKWQFPEDMNGTGRILITGATSQIGGFLIPMLGSKGMDVTAITRSSGGSPARARVRWFSADLAAGVDWGSLGVHRTVISLGPLGLAAAHLRSWSALGVRRVIAFGSTSVWTKGGSTHVGERRLIEALVKAEIELRSVSTELGVSWTLFRPTMIYGAGMDGNISTITRFVRRFRFFPMVGRGTGLRQPVHAEDLAHACIQVLDNAQTFNREYVLTGGETLTYREMVETIFRGLGLRPHIVTIPAPLMRALVRGVRVLPTYRHLNAEMVNRIDMNMAFDSTPATEDFGYHPRELLL